MEFLKDESGQGTAKYIFLIGAVIVIAIAAVLIFWLYLAPEVPQDMRVEQIYDPEDVPPRQ
jgi:hypothetical protein